MQYFLVILMSDIKYFNYFFRNQNLFMLKRELLNIPYKTVGILVSRLNRNETGILKIE